MWSRQSLSPLGPHSLYGYIKKYFHSSCEHILFLKQQQNQNSDQSKQNRYRCVDSSLNRGVVSNRGINMSNKGIHKPGTKQRLEKS